MRCSILYAKSITSLKMFLNELENVLIICGIFMRPATLRRWSRPVWWGLPGFTFHHIFIMNFSVSIFSTDPRHEV